MRAFYRMLFWVTIAFIGVVILAGCGTKTVVTPPPKPVLQQASTTLTAPCLPPVSIPQRDLTQYEVETLWSKDRKELVTCATKHKGTVTYYKERDVKLQGSKENN